MLTTKSHIPDTQKKEEIATIFGAGELLHGKLEPRSRGYAELAGRAHATARSTSIHQDTTEVFEASQTPVLFIPIAVY